MQDEKLTPDENLVEDAFLALMNARDRELSLPLNAWAERNLLKRRIAFLVGYLASEIVSREVAAQKERDAAIADSWAEVWTAAAPAIAAAIRSADNG